MEYVFKGLCTGFRLSAGGKCLLAVFEDVSPGHLSEIALPCALEDQEQFKLGGTYAASVSLETGKSADAVAVEAKL